MEERTTAGVVGMFIVLPLLAGGAMLCCVTINVVTHARHYTAIDWVWQVGWFGLLGLGLATALPAVGWQELRRRRKQSTPP